MSISLEPVTLQNGWTLIFHNNMLGIYKGNYYYSTDNKYHFKGLPVYYNVSGLIYLGVYKPIMADTNYLCSIQICIDNKHFIVNTLTHIVYIKPNDLFIIIPGNLPYNHELYSSYTFAGIYNPYMNSTSTSGKSFINMMPNTIVKTPKVESNQTTYSSPIENTLTDNPYPTKRVLPTPETYTNRGLLIPETYTNRGLLIPETYTNRGLLIPETYPKRGLLIPETYTNRGLLIPEKRETDMVKGNTISAINDIITFIIPFINTNNIYSLEKTVNSIISNVKNNRIIIVTSIELPDAIKNNVMILPYTRNVSKPGYENRLNVIMDNGYDIRSFYNYLITTYVKTYVYTIWNYNWEIECWPSSIATSRKYIVPNYYTYNNSNYKSLRTCTTGYILLNNKTRYTNTTDMFDITINGLGVRDIDNNIVVRGNYSETEFNTYKGLLLYGNELEVRDFYLKISKGITVDYVEKII